MLFRIFLMLLVSRLHPPFPPDFDLTNVPHSPCRILNRSSFSQQGCGACAAFAVSTAVAVQECVKRGRDVIPSPHRLFDCADGECEYGAQLRNVVEVLNMIEVEDVDVAAAQFGIKCKHPDNILGSLHKMGLPHWYSLFSVDHDDELMMKTELYLFNNPILAVFKPDMEMMLYSSSFRVIGHTAHHSNWLVQPRTTHEPLPVYHITGTQLSSHVVVILGWGSHPEPHWVVQNSWGDAWGDHGRGRIAMDDLAAAAVLDYKVWQTNWVMTTSIVVWLLVVVLEFGPEFWRWVCGKKGLVLKLKVEDDGGWGVGV